MIYKCLPGPIVEGEQQIYARIDDDGKCRLPLSGQTVTISSGSKWVVL